MLRWSGRVAVVLALAATSIALAASVTLALFLSGSRTIVLAGHDTVVSPTLAPHAVLHTGPLLPDFRIRDVGWVGVDLTLGKTEVGSVEELTQRYAFIAAEPDAQVAKVERAVRDVAISALLRGIGIGLLPVVVWLLLGEHRRGELFRGLRTRRGIFALALVLVLPALVWQPWHRGEETQEARNRWVPLGEFIGPDVALPPEAGQLEVLSGPTTQQTKRLLVSAVDTYETSKTFYREAAADAADLDLRERGSGETVALLVSDRHDNIGMDRVARAIGQRAGATVVLNAGDDTSTGQPWEAFSLDSLEATFGDWHRFGIAGNHDHGTFVRDYLVDLDWEMLDGEVVRAPWGGLLLGVDDPRSSGLGNWRDETGLGFDEVGERLADTACAADERISLLLVHDVNLGQEALRRGCADLAVGGHTHVHAGPDEVEAEDGSLGYEWTNGTTGGAAYAIAVGSKPRRDAEVSLITFRDGRPIGLQWVRLRTDGSFIVGDWEPIDPYPEPALAAPAPGGG